MLDLPAGLPYLSAMSDVDGEPVILEEPGLLQAGDCVIAGMSHVVALGVAGIRPAPQFIHAGHPADRMFGLLGAWPRDDAYWDTLKDVAPGRFIALSWHGNQHLVLHLLAHDMPFDFILPDRPDIAPAPGAVLVPYARIAEQAALGYPDLEPFAAEIARRGGTAIILGTPPPKGDDAFIRSWMKTESYFGTVAAQRGYDAATVPFSPPALRWKLWVAAQDALRTIAARTGALFLPVPAAAITDDGFLKPEFCAPDATHANPAYGELMLADLAQLLAQHRAGR